MKFQTTNPCTGRDFEAADVEAAKADIEREFANIATAGCNRTTKWFERNGVFYYHIFTAKGRLITGASLKGV